MKRGRRASERARNSRSSPRRACHTWGDIGPGDHAGTSNGRHRTSAHRGDVRERPWSPPGGSHSWHTRNTGGPSGRFCHLSMVVRDEQAEAHAGRACHHRSRTRHIPRCANVWNYLVRVLSARSVVARRGRRPGSNGINGSGLAPDRWRLRSACPCHDRPCPPPHTRPRAHDRHHRRLCACRPASSVPASSQAALDARCGR